MFSEPRARWPWFCPKLPSMCLTTQGSSRKGSWHLPCLQPQQTLSRWPCPPGAASLSRPHVDTQNFPSAHKMLKSHTNKLSVVETGAASHTRETTASLGKGKKGAQARSSPQHQHRPKQLPAACPQSKRMALLPVTTVPLGIQGAPLHHHQQHPSSSRSFSPQQVPETPGTWSYSVP